MSRKPEAKNVELAREILAVYQPKTVAEMQDALKDIVGPLFEAMLQGELSAHLGYESNGRGEKGTTNRRNGYSQKTLKTSAGNVEIQVPRDREGSFEPKLVKKRQRDISETIEEIYGFEISHEAISSITDCVLEELEQWQNRPLKKLYTFLFVDCLYVTLRKDYEAKKYAVYVILGYDTDGKKDILGLWLNETESKHHWMQIFDELKKRGVEDVLYLSMDGVTGLEEGAKAIFPHVVVQRCIVHLIRNSLKYIPSKNYKPFTAQLKRIYAAPSLTAAKSEFERFQQDWSRYPGAVNVNGSMWNSSLTWAARYVRSCTPPTPWRASIPACASSPEREPFRMKTHCSNCFISALQN